MAVIRLQLPDVVGKTPEDEIWACLERSVLWKWNIIKRQICGPVFFRWSRGGGGRESVARCVHSLWWHHRYSDPAGLWDRWQTHINIHKIHSLIIITQKHTLKQKLFYGFNKITLLCLTLSFHREAQGLCIHRVWTGRGEYLLKPSLIQIEYTGIIDLIKMLLISSLYSLAPNVNYFLLFLQDAAAAIDNMVGDRTTDFCCLIKSKTQLN